jgi:hypothetical protein
LYSKQGPRGFFFLFFFFGGGGGVVEFFCYCLVRLEFSTQGFTLAKQVF